MKVCYALAAYPSHRRAGLAHRAALAAAGVELVSDPSEADVRVLHAEPWAVPGYQRAFRGLPKRPTIGCVVWETDRLPAPFTRWLASVDRLWTPSRFSARALEATGKPVEVLPHPVVPPRAPPGAVEALRRRLGLSPDDLVLTVMADPANPRKGATLAVEAFRRAELGPHVKLVLKTLRPPPPALAELPGVVPLVGRVSDDEIAALHGLTDALVGLHHSEGFGLHLAEAMSLGKLAVATRYGGNTELMTDDNSLLVDADEVEIGPADVDARSAFEPGMRWGRPRLEHAVELLRRVASRDESLARLRAAAAGDAERLLPTALAAPMLAAARRALSPS